MGKPSRDGEIINGWVLEFNGDSSSSGRRVYTTTCINCGESDGISRRCAYIKKKTHRCCEDTGLLSRGHVKVGDVVNNHTVIDKYSVTCNTCGTVKKNLDGLSVSRIKVFKQECCKHVQGITNGYSYKHNGDTIVNGKAIKLYDVECINCGAVKNVRMANIIRSKHMCCKTNSRSSGIANGYRYEQVSYGDASRPTHKYRITCTKCGVTYPKTHEFRRILSLNHSCCADRYPFKIVNRSTSEIYMECVECGAKEESVSIHTLSKSRCPKCCATDVDKLASMKVRIHKITGFDDTILVNEGYQKGIIAAKLIKEKGLNKAMSLIKLKVD